MSRHAAPCAFAVFAMLAAAEPSDQAEECPKEAGSEVVVRALRSSDGRSYAYRVTNNGTSPIYNLSIGRAGDTFIEDSHGANPTSMGSPTGWKGSYERLQEYPRQPGPPAPKLIHYFWHAEGSGAWVQPGRSLSGFSVQLPTPEEVKLAYQRYRESSGDDAEPMEDAPFEQLPPQPDLTAVHFRVRSDRRCALVGTVERDPGWEGGDSPDG